MTFVCEICGKTLKSDWGLKLHDKRHRGTGRFACCEKTCYTKQAFNRHRCSIQGVKKPFPCEQCGKKFSTKDDLNRHVRREVAAKQFTCLICNAKLREKIDLQAHLDNHNGEKNFACDMCEKRYRHRSSLSNRTEQNRQFIKTYTNVHRLNTQNIIQNIVTCLYITTYEL
ncbi:hypothetical protein DPMN_191886 [Dreissena polymorpha]|uniref:C2H2-type domain-containing protein n=1 Tax=Dreissena polymorpha TaxID=45954 RepID=A0A9D3Y035_DREPO|nr:hypothetical protein DPMN_191886 [Dreissena polymorpha]